MLYSPLFIQQQPEAAQRLVYAYLRGIRDYNDAFTKNRDRAEVSARATASRAVTRLRLTFSIFTRPAESRCESLRGIDLDIRKGCS